MSRSTRVQYVVMLAAAISVAGCASPAPPPQKPSADAPFHALAADILEDHFKRHPAGATDLGIHKYDDQLEDFSQAAITRESDAMKAFRSKLGAIDPATLSADNALDREQLLHAVDERVLELDVIQPWAKDPDTYSAAVTNAAYVIMKRNFAPPADRLKALIARERMMPGALQQARANLGRAVPIYTQIAVEQIDGDISLFQKDLPSAFSSVTDAALLAEFTKVNADVISVLEEYKAFIQKDVLPKAKEPFAYGADTYTKALASQEDVDIPLDRLLQIASADRDRNEAAFQAAAKAVDAHAPAETVLAKIQLDHPPAGKLLQTTQETLDAIRQFVVDHHIVTIPFSEPVHVQETPPFMRSTTSASMDTPGPFETAKLVPFYYMTLPDPRWSRAQQEDFMHQWYYAMMSNVSVHEVYPGHYMQFLNAKVFPSDVRKVFGANTNIEGWAHYCEQMMLDEGFHADDPKYRLAQLQDALLRDVRFIVGIRMHTQGMTVEEATKLFETGAHQPHQVAVSEAKRGTADALYGYYTIGKLMILKLRDDYKAKLGADYTLQKFHDAFLRLGPLPMPLIRKALLGDTSPAL